MRSVFISLRNPLLSAKGQIFWPLPLFLHNPISPNPFLHNPVSGNLQKVESFGCNQINPKVHCLIRSLSSESILVLEFEKKISSSFGLMGNVIESFFAGFAHSIGQLFGSPLDFLSGKSCSSVCGPTWDFICYIENFCVANLLKMAMVLVLSYIFLLFIYIMYKVGMFRCICHGVCGFLWAFFSCCFCSWRHCCTFLCLKLLNPKRRARNRAKRISDYSSEEDLSNPRRSIHHVDRFRKSLRPRSHRVSVGIRRDFHGSSCHGVRVSRTSRFARKGSKHRRRVR